MHLEQNATINVLYSGSTIRIDLPAQGTTLPVYLKRDRAEALAKLILATCEESRKEAGNQP